MKKEGRPRRTEWNPCKVRGCKNTMRNGAKGFCRTHYMAYRRGRIREDGTEIRPPMRVVSYGEGARCLVPECENRPVGLGLCNKHLIQHRDGKDLGVDVPERGHKRTTKSYQFTTCIVGGCDERAISRMMCSKHAQQRAAGIIDEDGNKLRDLKKWQRPRKDRWVGQQGYVLVKAPDGHPGARCDGSILEHRLVMEDHLGRYLEDFEIVHHKDGNPSNNEISNLVLMDSRKGSGDRHPPGHEPLEEVESHLSALEEAIHNGMSRGAEFKDRLRRLARRL